MSNIYKNRKQDKLLPIEKEKLVVKLTQERFTLPSALQSKIDKHWEVLSEKKEPLFRGEVFTISKLEEIGGKIIVQVDLSDYAHYLYTRRIGLPEKTACKNMHTACLIETQDGVLVFGRMGKATALPGNVQCVGGGLDKEDIFEDGLDLEHNIKKELMEEVGVDIADSFLVADFSLKYLKYSSVIYSVAAIFILKLKITAKEFTESYKSFEAGLTTAGTLPEFGELIYLPKNKLALKNFHQKEQAFLDHYMSSLLKEVIG